MVSIKPFIKLFKTPLGCYFYDVNSNNLVRVKQDIFDLLMRDNNNEIDGESITVSQNCLKDLYNSGFLYGSDTIKVVKHSMSDYLSNLSKNNISKITLQVTQQCNLKCKYCAYAYPEDGKQRKHTQKSMPFNIAKKAIDYLLCHSQNCSSLNIGFYGGEPLLEFGLIRKCVNYIENKEIGKEVNFNMTTNATLLDEEKIRFLVKYKFHLLISLDGPKEYHDKNRLFWDDTGSYDKVQKVIKKIEEIDMEYAKTVSTNSVIDPENEFSCYSQFFINSDIVKNLKIRVSGLKQDNIINKYKKNRDFDIQFKTEKFKYFLYLLGILKETDVSPLIKFSFIGVDRLGEAINIRQRISKTMHHSGPCIPGIKRLFVDVSGRFFPCERCSELSDIMCIGNIDDGIEIEKAKTLLNIGSLTSEECKKCWNIRFCNICAANIENSTELSREKKIALCNKTRSDTYRNFLDYILLKEQKYKFNTEVLNEQ